MFQGGVDNLFRPCVSLLLLLEVIIDDGSAFVTRVERSPVSRPIDAPDKISRYRGG